MVIDAVITVPRDFYETLTDIDFANLETCLAEGFQVFLNSMDRPGVDFEVFIDE